MREWLFSRFSSSDIEFVGFVILVIGLGGELLLLFFPHGKDKAEKILTGLCVIAIILGVWLEHIGAEQTAAPRRLTTIEKQRLVDAVKSFGEVPFVMQFALGAEPLDLTLDIGEALSSAGWRWLACPGGISGNNKPPACLSILRHIEVQAPSGPLNAPANAVISALRGTKFEDVRGPIASDAPLVVILVGAKN